VPAFSLLFHGTPGGREGKFAQQEHEQREGLW
jgi:hypothetical protein